MANMNYVVAAPIASINSASVTGTLQVVNTSGFPGPAFLIRITNASTAAIAVSFDGAHANDYIAAGTSLQLDFQTNSQPQNRACLMKQGTNVYVSGTAGTGYIYVSAYYVATQN